MFLIIGLVEGMYFINLALGFFFIYVIAALRVCDDVAWRCPAAGRPAHAERDVLCRADRVHPDDPHPREVGVPRHHQGGRPNARTRSKPASRPQPSRKSVSPTCRSQVEQTLEEARTQAREILNRAHREATADTAEEVLAKARADAEALIERARTEIGGERDRAIQDLRAEVANMVIAATAASARRSAIDAKAHQRLIDEALQKVGDNPGAKAQQN